MLQPAVYAMIPRWSVPKNRSFIVCVISIGIDAGIIAGLVLTGVLCDYGFAGGWPSAFYVFGMFGCVWSVAWFFFCYNSPYTHPRISKAELEFWEREIGSEDLTEHPPTPWRKILTSVPVWALAVAFFANNWGFFTIIICLPLYMYDVLGFNMTRNGVFSALPFLSSFLAIPVYGVLVDWLRSPGRLSTTVVRKAVCVVGYILSGCFLIVTGHTGCDRTWAEAILFAALACICMAVSCIHVNPLDLAPLHAGKIMGLVYTVANLGTIAAPITVGVLTYERSTRDEWQKVFFLAAGIYAVGAVVFVVFGSGERQSWAE